MSGIAGIVCLRGAKTLFLAGFVRQMLLKLRHRGKDNIVLFAQGKNRTKQAVWNQSLTTILPTKFITFSPKLVLGQCFRQSLIGLPSTSSTNEKVRIFFDGQIYNYQELQKELEGKGHLFKTQSNGEIVLHAYREWGKSCLHRFNGRWAFVLYDVEKKLLWGCRDRIGVKPLYYFKQPSYFGFASEPKAFLELPFPENKINRGAVFDFLVMGKSDLLEETWLAGIFQLLPAHEFTLDLKSHEFKTQRWYQLPKTAAFEKFNPTTFEKYREKVRELMTTAVQTRLDYSNSPSSLLSGGLDSSVLVGILNNLQKEGVTALTASYEDERYGEQKWAAAVVEKTGARWLQTFPNSTGFLADLEDLFYAQDGPTISPGTYAQFCLMRLAKEHDIGFVFDGQGADGLFGGHVFYLPAFWKELLKKGQMESFLQEVKSYGGLSSGVKHLIQNHLKYSLLPQTPPSFQYLFKRQYFNELRYLNPEFLHENKHRFERYAGNPLTSLNEMLYKSYFCGDVSFLLKCVDRSSQWHGVESCTPYCDDAPLMEYLFSIPSAYKIRQGVRKLLLREAFRDLLPSVVYDRTDKMGLVTPANRWMAEIKDAVYPFFEEEDGAIFNKKLLLKDYNKFFSPRSPVENYRVYKFMSYAIWQHVFAEHIRP